MPRVQGSGVTPWKHHTADGAPARAILPVFDTEGAGPALAYQVIAGDDSAQIIIRGENLTGITEVDVSTDVNVPGPNPGDPPIVGALTVTDTSIIVPLNAEESDFQALWGIILRDGDGNVYGAPSPIHIFNGG